MYLRSLRRQCVAVRTRCTHVLESKSLASSQFALRCWLNSYRRKRVAFVYFWYNKFLLKQNKRYWIYSYIGLRLTKRRFYICFGDLREISDKFFKTYQWVFSHLMSLQENRTQDSVTRYLDQTLHANTLNSLGESLLLSGEWLVKCENISYI